MENGLIKDYKIRCYNLQMKITPFKCNLESISRRASKIQRKEKCDELTALKLLKKQLEKEVAEKNEK